MLFTRIKKHMAYLKTINIKIKRMPILINDIL